MRSLVVAASILMAGLPATGFAQAAPATAVGYSVAETDIGTLLDDPAAKAILDRHVPGFTAKDQIDMARSMTLKSVQQYASDLLTDKILSDIQVDLNKLPTRK